MIIDGKKVSEIIKNNIINEIKNELVRPCLAVIQIGDDESSNIYVNAKKKACKDVGFDFKHIKFDKNNSQDQIITKIKELNNDKNINGIIVQLPIENFDEYTIVNTITKEKDVDGLTDKNCGKLFKGKDCLTSCTAKGILELLNYYNIEVESKHVVIVGKSNLVGKPLLMLLLNKGATITICHSKTIDLKYLTKQADILISVVGKKHIITKDMVKENSVVIDVGISRIDGKIYGDVDFENIKEKAAYITPTPGGVGPMTIAMLLNNVLINYKNMKKN